MPESIIAGAPDGAPPSETGIPLVRAILEGTAARVVRLAAARGALPVPRPALFRLLVALSGGDDGEIAREAGETLRSWNENEIQEMAADTGTDAAVLVFVLRRPETNTTLLATVLSNAATPVEAMADAARTFEAEKIDTILMNQTLLLQHPLLLDQIEANPAATSVHRARVDEIKRHFFSRPVAHADPAPAVPGPGAEASDSFPRGGASTHRAPGTAPHVPASPAGPPPGASAEQEGATTEEPGPEEGEEPALNEGTMQRIFKMNVGEKIQLASKGTREERTLLIRDTNRSVQDAVLNSPKITESEIDRISRMRNVNEDILRQIAGHRDWLKSYGVMQGLATNPKTPIGIAMTLIPRLTTRDLKMLQSDKNVPDVIRRIARKQVEMRVNKPGSTGQSGH